MIGGNHPLRLLRMTVLRILGRREHPASSESWFVLGTKIDWPQGLRAYSDGDVARSFVPQGASLRRRGERVTQVPSMCSAMERRSNVTDRTK